MSDSIKIIGLDEKIAALNGFVDGLNDAAAQGLQEGMLPITGAMKTYPPQRPTSYVRTNDYMNAISTPYITNDGGYVTGQIDSPDPASYWVRGTQDVSYHAWMHPDWTTLFDIVRQFLPGIVDAVQSRIDALAARLGLS